MRSDGPRMGHLSLKFVRSIWNRSRILAEDSAVVSLAERPGFADDDSHEAGPGRTRRSGCRTWRWVCLGVVRSSGVEPRDAGSRISRYGVVAQGWAENIAYGQRSARAIVMALIVDDGMRGRDHRRNIFNPNYNAAGAAYGPHARYDSVGSIDLLRRGHVRTCWNRCREFVLTTRHQLSVAVPLRPRFFENRLNGWIGLKQRVA